MKKFLWVLAGLVVAAAVAVGVYTRPMTLEQLYPDLTLSQSELAYGTYSDETSAENLFKSEAGSDAYIQLLQKLQGAKFRRSLHNLLPGEPDAEEPVGDFCWTVTLRFPDTDFSDGKIRKGDLLTLENHYGQLQAVIPYTQESLLLTAEEQEQFLFDVWSAILLTRN